MTAAALWRSAQKEIRALLPTWTACLVGVVVPGLLSDQLLPVALLSFGLGSVALGAQSMGQEYGQRTVPLLLSQPVSRTAIFLVKQGVLAAMLAALAAAIWMRVAGHGNPGIAGPLVVMVALGSLFLAPALTMVSGSGIAGLVFTIAVPLLLLALGNIAGMARYGSAAGSQIDALTMDVMWRGMTIVVMTSVIGSWWMFQRIEAVDGRGLEMRLPRWVPRARETSTRMRRRHPIRQLVLKELHLQQLPFAVAFLCLLAVGLVAVRGYFDPGASNFVILPLLLLQMATLPVLVGALASAEERQQGTLHWQLLLPVAAWQQWTVKAVVAITLALFLCIALPTVVLWGLALPGHLRLLAMGPVAVITLTSVGLYVSSLSSSGLRAVMISIPAVTMLLLSAQWMSAALSRVFIGFGGRHSVWWGSGLGSWWSIGVAAMVLSALFLYLACRNHSSSERPRTVLQRQVPLIAGVLILEMVVVTLLGVR